MAVRNNIISIVTPSYNQGPFLEETIQSVISQKGNFYIDYIIMDGGSTDNSVEIMQKYEHLLKSGELETLCLGIQFRWFSEKDRGQTHAINKGFEIAEGEIVAWINSDDAYIPDAFSTVMEHFAMYPEDDFLYGDGDVIDECGNLQWEWLSRPYNYDLMRSFHFLWNDFTNYIMQQATFWRKGVLDRIGMLDESFDYAMDVEYWVRAGSANLRLVHTPNKLGKFRMILGTKSLSSPTVFWPDMLEIFRRYNGARKMTHFLAFYYYNLAVHNKYRFDKTDEGTTKLFSRWEHLGKSEKDILHKKIEKGLALSCLLVMHTAYDNGEKQTSVMISTKIRRESPSLLIHPVFLFYIIKYLLGFNLSSRINSWLQTCIRKYRQVRYQNRYSH